MRVDVEQLRKHYGVDGISFSLDLGQCLAVVGVNGAGKSTLLHCLAGWLVPERDRVRYDEQRFSRQRLDLRRRLFFIPDATPVDPEQIVIDYLRDVLRAYESRSDNCANGIYYEGTISGSSDDDQSVALQEDGWFEPEQTEGSRPVPARAGGAVADNEFLSGESYSERSDNIHDFEFEPAELCRHYYRNRRRYRVWARVWFSSWKLRRDEIELLELRRAGALVPVNYNRSWIWIIGLTLGVSLLPEFLMFMLPILMIMLFRTSADSTFNSDFRRIHTLPVTLRTALLAELKYYWIHLLPWIGVAFACAVVWAVRQSIPWDEFLLASLRDLFLLAAGLPCIIALASICDLNMQWLSWSALGWSILLLTSMTIATVGGFMMMFLDGVWALAGAVPAAFAAWALWESCIQNYECGVSDLK